MDVIIGTGVVVIVQWIKRDGYGRREYGKYVLWGLWWTRLDIGVCWVRWWYKMWWWNVVIWDDVELGFMSEMWKCRIWWERYHRRKKDKMYTSRDLNIYLSLEVVRCFDRRRASQIPFHVGNTSPTHPSPSTPPTPLTILSTNIRPFSWNEILYIRYYFDKRHLKNVLH